MLQNDALLGSPGGKAYVVRTAITRVQNPGIENLVVVSVDPGQDAIPLVRLCVSTRALAKLVPDSRIGDQPLDVFEERPDVARRRKVPRPPVFDERITAGRVGADHRE